MTEHNKQTIADILIYGGTEAGIFTAVQAARKGLKTFLVSENSYLFGFFPSLGAWETHYPGCRAPLSKEVRDKIIDHYRLHYGEYSDQFKACVQLEDNNPMVTFEPHVAEKVLEGLLQAESNLTVLAPCHLINSDTRNGRVRSITVRCEDELVVFIARVFVDCSYTGDLAASAGARFSLGRESRSTYGELHAGRMFTRWRKGRFPRASLEGKLNVLPTWSTTDPLEESTGEGDENIQDYSYRICLCNNPKNRELPTKPEGYDRSRFTPLLHSPAEKALLPLTFHHRWLTQSIEDMMANDHLFHGHALPGNKRSWNATNLTGAGKEYPNADATRRKEIESQHIDYAIGLLYFLQNDSEVPETIRNEALSWGLAKDEFTNFHLIPPVMYIREARRFMADYVYREQDCLALEGLNRAPIHRDGIAFTEFALDSLACTPERVKGSLPDGQFFEKDKSLPGSLPWRCLLPSALSNLLVPTAPSVTHCTWGTVRQSACLLHLAEVCALAAEFSIKNDVDPADLSLIDLQIHLVQQGTMIAFFNDFDMTEPELWKEAALFFGNRGFFADYNARPDEPLDGRTANLWVEALASIVSGNSKSPRKVAFKVQKIDQSEETEFISGHGLSILTEGLGSLDLDSAVVLRKEGLEALYNVLLASRRRAGGNAN